MIQGTIDNWCRFTHIGNGFSVYKLPFQFNGTNK